MFFSSKLAKLYMGIIYAIAINLGLSSLSFLYAANNAKEEAPTKITDPQATKAQTQLTETPTPSVKKKRITSQIIEGRYHCTNVKGGHLRKLKIIEDEKISPTDEGFYSFSLYLTAGNSKVYGNSIGYMIFDSKRQTASGYLRNQVDNRVEGVGVLYFTLSDTGSISFEAYFIDKLESRVGSNLCVKQSNSHIHQQSDK
ncbi:hypothetical protein [Shewanella surugensis]|uniref:DUF4352 domain-containing protein n=1 Tax=Shewanella surugensis TaxID=212020 RepID=A0ABT0LBS9_9GAMM|nr:hypothetical protein [Shewanella surugensis]MCL1125105.1 hypothetical protein [Shewanella surugensis]